MSEKPDQPEQVSDSEQLSARLAKLMQSRREFITKTLGVAAGAAAAAYVAPDFTSVNAKPAYASITGGTTPSPTPTEKPTVPTVPITNSASMFTGGGRFSVSARPFKDPPQVVLETYTVTGHDIKKTVSANIAGVAGGLVVVLDKPLVSNTELEFSILVDGIAPTVKCTIPAGGTQADSGAATGLVPAASIISLNQKKTSNPASPGGEYSFMFGWYWREI